MAFQNVTAILLIHLIKDHESKKDFSTLTEFPLESAIRFKWLFRIMLALLYVVFSMCVYIQVRHVYCIFLFHFCLFGHQVEKKRMEYWEGTMLSDCVTIPSNVLQRVDFNYL